MRFVLDASVALSWCFDDEQSEYADHVESVLLGGSAVVPAIWPLEVANALRQAERRGRISSEDVEGNFVDFSMLPIQVLPPTRLADVPRLIALARDYGLSVYDGAYLDIALRYAVPLVSLDSKLLSACSEAGVATTL